jgi:DNA-binding HxlR family transcriptional regulator
MQNSKANKWIAKEERRRKILIALKQPLTAKQIARNTGIPMDTCSYTISKFTAKGLATCLNPEARNSRLYWTTELGRGCRKQLHQDLNLPEKEYDLPSVNWPLYGWVCYSHRAAVIRVLSEPMQPSEVKRTLRIRKPNIKISANNIRDVVKLLLENGIVQKVYIRKKAHPLYELTDTGNQFRQLLIQSEMVS